MLQPLLFVAAFLPTVVGGQKIGAVQSVAVKPNPVNAGTPAAATAGGVNPCGAVYIDWGDGTAITYAITNLPATQTHPYRYGGRFTVVAKGMGNCTGEVRTTLEVKGPPPPPPPRAPSAKITRVDMTPSPAIVRQPVEFAVMGTGTCAFSLDFGDGNSQNESGPLPRTVRHTYSVPDTFVVIVQPTPPCVGKFTQKLTVSAPDLSAQLSGITVTPVRAQAGQPVVIDVLGIGDCRYSIDFGDGNSDVRFLTLPDRIRHNYPAPDRYTIAVAAEYPCVGSARTSLVVQPPR